MSKVSATQQINNKEEKPARFYQMDLVRYFLAIAVIVAHFNAVFGCRYYWPTSSATAVGVFFGFSGFLVYASYLRHNNLSAYILSRAKRIIPAYWFIVISCTLFLSTISTLSYREYFCDAQTWRYLLANLCFLNFLQPELPGVFVDNAYPAVNGSLWTLKVEWMLYLSIPLFFYVCKKYKVHFIVAISALFLFSLIYSNAMEYYSSISGNHLYYKLSYQFAGQFTFFYTGVCCYIYKNYFLTHKLKLFIMGSAFLLVSYLSTTIFEDNLASDIMNQILFPIGCVIVFLALSLSKVISSRFTILGNCSYEMYLFHFPIFQCLATSHSFCSLPKWSMFAISLTIVYALALLVNKATRTFIK